MFRGKPEPIFSKDGTGRVVGQRYENGVIIDVSEVDMRISTKTASRLRAGGVSSSPFTSIWPRSVIPIKIG